MSTTIEILAKQAIQTFARNKNVSHCFDDSLRVLKKLVDKITIKDVNLETSMINKKVSKAQITYIDIYEDKNVTIGIFVLQPGSSLPLHDHPQMHGILKVLCGTVQIQSYTILETRPASGMTRLLPQFSGRRKETIVAEKHNAISLSASDESCTLTAVNQNLHEIHHVEGQYAAFLDVLAPPYTDPHEDRDCHYFEVLQHEEQNPALVLLQQIPTPPTFWSDTAPYLGPPVRHLRHTPEDT